MKNNKIKLNLSRKNKTIKQILIYKKFLVHLNGFIKSYYIYNLNLKFLVLLIFIYFYNRQNSCMVI